jgi:dephospho-CoA kinase
VACEPDTQIRRLIARDGLSEAEAARRIEAQLPITEKIRRGDYVIRTDAGFEDTNRQIARIHALLTQRTSGTAQPESGTRRGS